MPLASRSSTAYKLQPIPKPQKAAVSSNTKRTKKTKKNLKNKIVLLVVSVFIVQLFICYRWVALYDLHSKMESQNMALSELQRENEQKTVTIDSMIDGSKVEEYAINQLGMQKIDSNQIVYIHPEHGDSMQKVAKTNPRSSKRSIFGTLSASIGELLEYLK